MQLEKQWPLVLPQLLTANGTNVGVVTVANSEGFYMKQIVALAGSGLPNINGQIINFLSDYSFVVGDVSTRQPLNLSAYTTALSSTVSAAQQSRTSIKPDDTTRAVYQEDPVTAVRVINVDPRGNIIDGTKPLTTTVANSTVPVAYDSFQVLSVDANDNPLTIAYYVGGLTGTQVWLSTFTYDYQGSVSSYVGTV
jgi:hypothetical protein